MQIIIPVAILAGLGLVFGIVLAIASRVFAVKVDERVPAIVEKLPGANCGGCGYSGCAALAEAIVSGKASPDSCTVGGGEVAAAIGEIMGVKVEATKRMRAQVMCSGTGELTTKKYIYAGAHDCEAAARLGGGDKLCPNSCIGLGSCSAACPFDAIRVVDDVAVVESDKCRGCGVCVAACPRHIIKMIPYGAAQWVGCMSAEKGALTRKQCEIGCIGCRICEKNCPQGAIKVNGALAAIDYSLCSECGVCAEKCPRHIIHTADKNGGRLTVSSEAAK